MNITELPQILGRPYYESDDCHIYNLECVSAMQKLPAGFVDLTVTSPPYNIGKAYENPLPLSDYLKWSTQWTNEVFRLTQANGAFWWNLGYVEVEGKGKAVPLAYLLWNSVDFYLMQEVVWHYGAGVAAKRSLSPRNEKFLWYVKNPEMYTFNLDEIRDPDVKYPNQKKNGKLKCNPLGKNPSDVWEFPKVTSGTNRSSKERTAHPAQFPTAVIERIIRGCSNPGELVLDPFMGSGTTAVVALSLGRKVVGFEISEPYCRIAADRIEDFLDQRRREAAQLRLDGV